MTQIRTVYHPGPDGKRREPNFPATDQHPQAVRYAVDHPVAGLLTVDAVGPAPTATEVDVHLGTDAPALATQQRVTQDAAEREVCKVDPDVAAFLNFTPAQLDAWVDANITGAGNKVAFKVLGKLALMGARGRPLRNG